MDESQELKNRIQTLESKLEELTYVFENHSHDGYDRSSAHRDSRLRAMQKSGDDEIKMRSDVLPDEDSAYDLGSSSIRWANIYTDSLDATTLNGVPAFKIYYGIVASNGVAGSPFPSGWSSAKDATGEYTITHNLNDANTVIMLTTNTTTRAFPLAVDIAANTFEVRTYLDGESAADCSFHFVVVKNA